MVKNTAKDGATQSAFCPPPQFRPDAAPPAPRYSAQNDTQPPPRYHARQAVSAPPLTVHAGAHGCVLAILPQGQIEAITARDLYDWFASKGYGKLTRAQIDQGWRATGHEPQCEDHLMFALLLNNFDSLKDQNPTWFFGVRFEGITDHDLRRNLELKERNIGEASHL